MLVAFGSLATTAPLVGQPSFSTSGAQTNSALPGHVLSGVLSTNRIGTYSLPYHWAGQEKITAVAGYYAIKGDAPRHTNDHLYFDSLNIGSGPLVKGILFKGPKINTPAALYRDKLPADVELLKLRSLGAVTNFMGWNPFSDPLTHPGAEAVGARYFTLQPDNAIETLLITLRRSEPPDTIDGILIKRAFLLPAASKH